MMITYRNKKTGAKSTITKEEWEQTISTERMSRLSKSFGRSTMIKWQDLFEIVDTNKEVVDVKQVAPSQLSPENAGESQSLN